MTKVQKETVNSQLILLDKKDVMELTGWGDNVTNRIFAYDKQFPAVRIREKISSRIISIKTIFK